MRVLHVTHNFPRWAGDFSGNFLLALAREQTALGDEVTLVAPHAAGAAEQEKVGDVRVERFRYAPDADETLAYTGVMHEQVMRSWRARFTLLRFLRELRGATGRLVASWQPDVVHVHWWFPGGVVLAPAGVVGRTPVMITSHGTDLFLLRKLPALRIAARPIFARASVVTTVSRALADELPALAVDPSRVHVVPMPLDLETFGVNSQALEPRDADHVLFVGRLSVQKGAADLLRALAELARTRPSLRATIIGDGTERARLEQSARELGVAERVTFRGSRDTRDVARAYRTASVLAVPSTVGAAGEREGFGLVAVEAMLAGLPVVATATGGLVDIVRDGETGLLVQAGNPSAMAGALARLLSDPAAARAIAERARADVTRRFAPSAIAERYRALYRGMTEPNR
jgi:phosphatidyl-myo-inositol dimannoside synthase